MHHSFIAVEGPIGVGKTSLAEGLARRMDNVMNIMEDVSNPFLPDFYKDASGSAFRTQLYFLVSRFEQLKGLKQRELFRQTIVSDFMFEKDKIFAYLTLSDSELMVYEKIYRLLLPEVTKPEMVIYLTASTKTLARRVALRGRGFEEGIDTEYLREVSRAYNYYFFNYTSTPLLVINTDDIDFVKRGEDLDDLVQQIQSMDHGTQYYIPQRS